jgi:hypothetical protein
MALCMNVYIYIYIYIYIQWRTQNSFIGEGVTVCRNIKKYSLYNYVIFLSKTKVQIILENVYFTV